MTRDYVILAMSISYYMSEQMIGAAKGSIKLEKGLHNVAFFSKT